MAAARQSSSSLGAPSASHRFLSGCALLRDDVNTSDEDEFANYKVALAANILGTDAAFASDAAFADGDGGDAVSTSSISGSGIIENGVEI